MDERQARLLFGQHLRALRQQRLLTQEQLAERIEKTPEYISLLERGERAPSFDALLLLAQALELPLPALLAFTGQPLSSSLPSPAASLETSLPLPEPAAGSPAKAPAHRQRDLTRFLRAYEQIQDLQELAREYGINDVFQDNGGKVLQMLIILGLRILSGREGNDAIDA
uniref:HTH cro/C1-type domain-containing protein n=1 Tax=Thermogemmatispora argillosa TaxID=2045280 RepID=A0A455SUZ1_9CHLR|nr:hypothetical protein KTA_03960 [Thermogemmatispora argillosa]